MRFHFILFCPNEVFTMQNMCLQCRQTHDYALCIGNLISISLCIFFGGLRSGPSCRRGGCSYVPINSSAANQHGCSRRHETHLRNGRIVCGGGGGCSGGDGQTENVKLQTGLVSELPRELCTGTNTCSLLTSSRFGYVYTFNMSLPG